MAKTASRFEQAAFKQPVDGELVEAEQVGGFGRFVSEPPGWLLFQRV
jgi:hypothetical protein